jgi:hypothetical protein
MVARMMKQTRLLPLLCLPLFCSLAGCAPANYIFSFDLTDPGAVNYKDARRPDVMEDGDLKLEVRLDATEFKAIAVEITNKTDMPVQLGNGFAIVTPEREQRALAPNAAIAPIEPTAKVGFQLGPFELPSVGPPAKMYNDTNFELVLTLVVRGQPREYRLHFHALAQKL